MTVKPAPGSRPLEAQDDTHPYESDAIGISRRLLRGHLREGGEVAEMPVARRKERRDCAESRRYCGARISQMLKLYLSPVGAVSLMVTLVPAAATGLVVR